MRKLLLLPLASAMLVSCQQENIKVVEVEVSTSAKSLTTTKSVDETDIEYSNKLARIGEILVNNPVGVAHADDIFKRALKYNPNNSKALLYSSFTGIVMSTKGLVKRTQTMHDSPEEYNKVLKGLKESMNYPEYINFLRGKPSQATINTYQEAKEFITDELIASMDQGISNLEKISEEDVKINLVQLETDVTWNETSCETVEDDYGSWEDCNYEATMNEINPLKPIEKTIDSTDIKAIANTLKIYSTMSKLLTAYKIEGAKALNNEIEMKKQQLGRELKDIEVEAILKRYPEVLVLEERNQLASVADNLTDIANAAMDFHTLSQEFCDTEQRTQNLIQTICMNANERESIEEALDALAGPVEVTLGETEEGVEVKILTDITAILKNPIQDLKTLTPDQYNDAGEGNYTQEPNLNGLFPNNDLLEKTNLLK